MIVDVEEGEDKVKEIPISLIEVVKVEVIIILIEFMAMEEFKFNSGNYKS